MAGRGWKFWLAFAALVAFVFVASGAHEVVVYTFPPRDLSVKASAALLRAMISQNGIAAMRLRGSNEPEAVAAREAINAETARFRDELALVDRLDRLRASGQRAKRGPFARGARG